MIVVDTNIISYFYLKTTFTESAEKLFQKDPNWNVPFLWRSEFRNVLAFYIKKKMLSLSTAVQIYEIAENRLRQNEYEIDSARLLRLSQLSGCSAYDCEYVNLAQDLNVALITMDKNILTAFPETACTIKDYDSSH